MKYNVDLFYNYHTVGDVVMAVIDNEAIPTSFEREGNVVYIYQDNALIGINFFDISSICKIRSIGPIYKAPQALLDVLNSMIPAKKEITISSSNDSLFRIAQIVKVEQIEKNVYHLICNIGYEVNVLCYSKEIPLERALCVIALNGALKANGKHVNEKYLNQISYQGICCSEKDINGTSESDAIVYVEANAHIGADFFKTKGSL